MPLACLPVLRPALQATCSAVCVSCSVYTVNTIFCIGFLCRKEASGKKGAAHGSPLPLTAHLVSAFAPDL